MEREQEKKKRVRNEGSRVESFHNLRIHKLTWRLVSVHSESADGEYNLKAACEAERDLERVRGKRGLNTEKTPCGYE